MDDRVILDVMEERRKVKEEDRMKYRKMNRDIKNKIRQSKDRWFREECEKIEKLDNRYETSNRGSHRWLDKQA